MGLPWPLNRRRVRLLPVGEDGAPDYNPSVAGPWSGPGVPPVGVLAAEPWAIDFDPRSTPQHRELLRKIYLLRRARGQEWVVKKRVQKRGHRTWMWLDVCTFGEYPTSDQIAAEVEGPWGGGEYHIWAMKPQPPQHVFTVRIRGESVNTLADESNEGDRKPQPTDPFAALEAQAAASLANNPAALKAVGEGLLAKRWGVTPPEHSMGRPPEDADEKAVLAAHPELAQRAAAARLAKRYGVRLKDLLPAQPAQDGDDESDELDRVVKFLAKAKKMRGLLGLGAETVASPGGGPSFFSPIIEGVGKMIANTDGVQVMKALGSLGGGGGAGGDRAAGPRGAVPLRPSPPVPAISGPAPKADHPAVELDDPETGRPFVFTESPAQPQGPGSEVAALPATAPVEGAEMSVSSAQVPATPADGLSYKHLLAETFTDEGRWTEYPPSATAEEALAKVTGLIDGKEALSWLMGLDWGALQTQLQSRPPEFVQWLGRQAQAGDRGWAGLFKVLASMHPHSMLLIFRKGLSISLVRLSPAGALCQTFMTEEGARYLTFAMALAHEVQAKYSVGSSGNPAPTAPAGQSAEANGADGGDRDANPDGDELDGMR